MPNYRLSVTVDHSDREMRNIKAAPAIIADAAKSAGIRVQQDLQVSIYRLFEAACNLASEGFPIIYKTALLFAVASLPVNLTTTGAGFSVNVNLGLLGTKSDLEEGYHYKAQLSNGGFSDIPYTGQGLANSLATRYQFWLSVATKVKADGMPPANSDALTETYAAREAYWTMKGVAPQWLLLNWGQQEYAPFIRPFPIIEYVRAIIYKTSADIFTEEILFAERKIAKKHFEFGRISPGASEERIASFAGAVQTAFEGGSDSEEAFGKFQRFPHFYKEYIAAVLRATTDEEVIKATRELASLEAVEFSALSRVIRPTAPRFRRQSFIFGDDDYY